MKNIKPIIILGLLMAVFSCQKEEIKDTETANFTVIQSSRGLDEEAPYTAQEILEINLRWTGFISSKVVKHNIPARNEVLALLQNGNEAIKLSQLLNDQNSEFYNSFHSYLYFYLGGGHPGSVGGKPNPPAVLPPGGMSMEQKFLNYILNQNCIELYFPKPLEFFTDFEITSTGHPLDTSNSNQGLVLSHIEPGPSDGPDDYNYLVDLNLNYVNANNNIIIARPFRNFINPNCGYSEYNGIDFTDFLDI